MALKHIGLIPDGTRRWARKNEIDYFDAYLTSFTKVINCVEFFRKRKIEIISIYCLSKQNLSRSKIDLEAVIKAETNFFSDSLYNYCEMHSCKVNIIGDSNILPNNLRDASQSINKRTVKNKGLIINCLLGYDPFDEINSIPSKLISLNDLWVPENVDLIIRTAGGPTMLSNFLPLQSGYAQIYMIDKYFNDCNEKDFIEIVDKFNKVIMLLGK
ncbi:MAG: hypothetical protein GYA51_02385 [Candidatus Methanofastidiosa archaeon]|nr:hypothetical protein [Candidatus Methanofastidiosa archaeon]